MGTFRVMPVFSATSSAVDSCTGLGSWLTSPLSWGFFPVQAASASTQQAASASIHNFFIVALPFLGITFLRRYSPPKSSQKHTNHTNPAITRQAPAASASISNSPAMTSTGAMKDSFFVR